MPPAEGEDDATGQRGRTDRNGTSGPTDPADRNGTSEPAGPGTRNDASGPADLANRNGLAGLSDLADRNDEAVTAAGGLVVVALAVFAHYEVLGYWFTGADTLTLIETSRVTEPGDAVDILAEPLMHGTAFVDVALFYRPVASLSYALDHLVWGLDPFGYHLTDLLLHAAAALAAFLLVNRVTRGDLLTAVVAGAVFAVHPLSVEAVPTPARRHDVLVAAFLALSLWLFVRWVDAPDRPAPLAGSVVAYLLALGSKETGVILVPLAGTWYALAWFEGDADLRPFLGRGLQAATAFGGATVAYLAVRYAVLGGVGGYVGRAIPQSPKEITAARYARSLFYPVDYHSYLFSLDLRPVPGVLYVVLAGALVLAALAVLDAGGLRPLLASRRGRAVAVFGLWVLVPLPLFFRVGRYTVRSGYHATIPVAAAAAILLVPAARRLRAGEFGTNVATVLVAGVLALSLVAGSPLLHPYDGWEKAGEVSEGILSATADRTDSSDETLVVDGVPSVRSTRALTDPPRARSVTYVWANSIESWLRMRHGMDPDVHVDDTTTLSGMPNGVEATARMDGDQKRIGLRYEGTERGHSRLSPGSGGEPPPDGVSRLAPSDTY